MSLRQASTTQSTTVRLCLLCLHTIVTGERVVVDPPVNGPDGQRKTQAQVRGRRKVGAGIRNNQDDEEATKDDEAVVVGVGVGAAAVRAGVRTETTEGPAGDLL